MTEIIITPLARVAPVHLVETGEYSITLLFDAKDIEPIEKAIAKVMPKKKGTRSPLHYSKNLGYRLRLKSKPKSQVKAVNVIKKPIPLENILPGAIVRVQASFASYEQGGGGVTAYLGNIQLLRESPNKVNEVDLGFDDIEQG